MNISIVFDRLTIVVDSAPRLRKSIKKHFSERGWEVVGPYDGSSALYADLNANGDLINGIEVAVVEHNLGPRSDPGIDIGRELKSRSADQIQVGRFCHLR